MDQSCKVVNGICDSISAAYQLGRLDLVSVLLGCITIILAIFGLLGFGYIIYLAKQEASKVARQIAEDAKNIAELKAEHSVNDYIQRELPQIMQEYLILRDSAVKILDADKIAENQENVQNE